MMIDWVSVLIPLAHSKQINGGNVVSVDPDGNIDWQVEKRLSVEGSYGASIQIRSEHYEGFCSHIRLDGNPVKWLQGHNVWGTTDLSGLVTACLSGVLALVAPEIACGVMIAGELASRRFAAVEPAEWLRTASGLQAIGNAVSPYVNCSKLTRIDITGMYDLGNPQRVLTWLRAAADSANMSHRGRGQFSGDTLYWGKKSRRWALKMYPKGAELKAHKPKKGITEHPHYLSGVTDFADKALRVELTLRGMELKDKRLSGVQDWREGVIETAYSSYLEGLEFSQNMKVTEIPPDLEKLEARHRAVVLAWHAGHDLRVMYPRATWYRYRTEIMKSISLDIALPPPNVLPERSNVIPLFTILHAKPMSVPDWAKGTSLYFEPPVYRHKLLSVV
jgi:hypothetical protein